MITLSLRLPDSYHSMVKEITAKDEISINQFIVSAIAEKFISKRFYTMRP